MKNFMLCGLLAALSVVSAFGQLNTLTGTTVSAAVALTDNTVALTSATGIVVPNATTGVTGSLLYVQGPGSKGEAMRIQSLVSGTTYNVARGVSGTRRVAAPSGALVLLGPANQFYTVDPAGGCTTASIYVTPYVNVLTGVQWLCSTITLSWVPGWNNPGTHQPTAAVASAAGAIIPSGPLFHVTGTAAVTGFTLPLGYNGGRFCIIPDGAFTTTTAGNIAIASTAVASKQLCYTYDAAAAKVFFASY